MMKFAYNNAKNASISHTSFKLNYRYHLYISYKKNLNLHSKSKTTEELSSELQKLMIIYQQNFYYIQKLQKLAHNKSVKLQSYALGEKI